MALQRLFPRPDGSAVLRTALAILLTAAAACATTQPEANRPPLPADGAALRAILASDPPEGWDLFPGRRERIPGSGSHGAFVTVRLNGVAAAGTGSRSRGLPAGSLIVCRGFAPSGEPSGMVVMARIAGYAPDHGDWYWLAVNPEGAITAEGTPAECLGCHGKVRSNDHVFSGALR